ncbi:IclR family transcriptional regulator [Paraburkholderia sp. J67]|uniref:IclR family transcriptional regulator n=1 Tax=Paraburkholderia sp. J67 TaxID=2805435 RepID=UPI002ABE8729|nr:IclR family transcriptional regulator [Paraburkholderia sp. J67]
MNDESESDSGSGKQVIARAAAVLRALENQSTGLSLGQIARAAELPRTTVHRLVNALEAQGFVTAGSQGVRLGPALSRLAASAHTDLVALAKPFVEALGRRTRETVDVCVRRGQHAVSVDQFPSDQELRVVSQIGTAFPVHCTAHGKALLAQLSGETLESALTGDLLNRTSKTETNRKRLIANLESIRSAGYAIDDQEHALGVCGLGVTIDVALPDAYAIALAVPAVRFQERFDDLLSALLQSKSEIEAAFEAR